MFTVNVQIINYRGNNIKLKQAKNMLDAQVKLIVQDIYNEAKNTQPSGYDVEVRNNPSSGRSKWMGNSGEYRYYEPNKHDSGKEENVGFAYPKIEFSHEGYVDDTGELRRSIRIQDDKSGLKYSVYITLDSDFEYWFFVEREYGYKVISHAIYGNLHRIRDVVYEFCQTMFREAMIEAVNNSINKTKGFKVV